MTTHNLNREIKTIFLHSQTHFQNFGEIQYICHSTLSSPGA